MTSETPPTVPTPGNGLFGVPHYHVVIDSDADDTVYTYEYAPGRHAARSVRVLLSEATRSGALVRVITCRTEPCRIYGQGTPDDLSEETIRARIDEARDVARRSEGREIP